MNVATTAADQAQGGLRSTPDPQRVELLRRTSRFRSCWHELAEALASCQRKGLHAKWGYESFEAYYRKELRLRPATVAKLLGSYKYLHAVAPELLQRDGVHESIPSAESVEFLRRSAEACALGRASSELLEQVRVAVLEQGCSAGVVEKRFGALLFPELPAQQQAKNRRDAIRTTAQLAARLDRMRETLPSAVLAQAEQALRQLLSVLEGAAGAEQPTEAAQPAAAPPAAAAEKSCSEQPRPVVSPDESSGTPADDGYDPRVHKAHRSAVLYLGAAEQGLDAEAVRRMKKSVQWHLRILSARNLHCLARLFPSESWRRLIAAGTEDPTLEPLLARLFQPSGGGPRSSERFAACPAS